MLRLYDRCQRKYYTFNYLLLLLQLSKSTTILINMATTAEISINIRILKISDMAITKAITIKIDEADRTIRVSNMNPVSVTFHSPHRSETSLAIVAILD